MIYEDWKMAAAVPYSLTGNHLLIRRLSDWKIIEPLNDWIAVPAKIGQYC